MWSPKLLLSTRFQILCSATSLLKPLVPTSLSLSLSTQSHSLLPVLNCSTHINERQIYLSASQIAFHWVSHIMLCHCGRHCELSILSWLKCHSHLSLLLITLYCRVDAQKVSKGFWKYFTDFFTSDKFPHISQSTPTLPLLFKQFTPKHVIWALEILRQGTHESQIM